MSGGVGRENRVKINSHNEWDRLREVIVGRAEGQANLLLPSNGHASPELLEKAERLARVAYPQWFIDEVNEDLDGLIDALRCFGAKVLRPNASHINRAFTTPYFSAVGDHAYNVRDLNLIVGNTVVESPSQEPHRYFEAMNLYDIWYGYFSEGFRWIAGPKPRLTGDYMVTYYADGRDQYDDGQKYINLTEDEILFEAANTVRLGRDLLYLVSRSGNNLGAKWLQSVLGDDCRVHTTGLYRSNHIDTTVVSLRPGLVLLNGERVTETNCPSVFDKWDKIYFHDIVPTPETTLELHERVRKKVYYQLAELGIESNLDSLSSPWIGMNMLSLDPWTVIVDERQGPLIKVLEENGITPVPIRFRHSYLIGGGIHCSTLDTVRDSESVRYCE